MDESHWMIKQWDQVGWWYKISSLQCQFMGLFILRVLATFFGILGYFMIVSCEHVSVSWHWMSRDRSAASHWVSALRWLHWWVVTAQSVVWCGRESWGPQSMPCGDSNAEIRALEYRYSITMQFCREFCYFVTPSAHSVTVTHWFWILIQDSGISGPIKTWKDLRYQKALFCLDVLTQSWATSEWQSLNSDSLNELWICSVGTFETSLLCGLNCL